jgi:predicted  nucleic acid-binding Zn-ribbon protein
LNEIGQCVKQIFSYDDITEVLYNAEHSAFLEAHDASMKQELDSVKATQETQVAELQSEIIHLHEQLNSARRECESLRVRLKKKKASEKPSYDNTVKSLQKLAKRRDDAFF